MPQAMRWARSWLGLDTEYSLASIERRPRHIPPAQSAEDEAAIGAARTIWGKAREIAGTRGETYFRHRGIDIDLPPTLRFHPALFHHPSGLALPAVVAAISGPGGKVTAVQCTFIRSDGCGKAEVEQPKITRGRMLNCAVRPAPAGPTLGIAEGVETALSAMQIHSAPVWAACGSRMDAIAIPDYVRWLAIFGDNGEPGVNAAERAAVKLAREGRTIKFVYPPEGHKDWNDALRAREVAA
jgi:DNA primase